MAADVTACRDAFGKCRKYEDDVGGVIHACTLNPDSLKSKLKSLAENEESIKEVQKKVTELAAKKRVLRRSMDTCTGVAEAVKKFLSLVGENPASKQIKALGKSIIAATPKCTQAEKDALTALNAGLTSALKALAAEIAAVQSTLAGNQVLTLPF